MSIDDDTYQWSMTSPRILAEQAYPSEIVAEKVTSPKIMTSQIFSDQMSVDTEDINRLIEKVNIKFEDKIKIDFLEKQIGIVSKTVNSVKDEYIIGKVIGKGTYGEVKECYKVGD